VKWSVKRTAETAIEPEESTLPPPANGVALYPEPSEASRRALDLTARFDRLSFGSSGAGEAFLNPRADHVAPVGKDAWTMGVNWHPNRWVKVQANTVREQLVDPLALLPLETTPLWSTVLRFQVAM